MKEEKRVYLEESFEALKPFWNVERFSPSRLEKMNEGIVSDILGEKGEANPPSILPRELWTLAHGIIQLHSCMNRFSTYEVMFKKYPWRGSIAKSQHFESVYYLYVHECYVFEERLKNYFDAVKKYAKFRNLDFKMSPSASAIIKLFHRSFQGPLRMRGQHVHLNDYVPQKIRRIGLLELMRKGKNDNSELANLWLSLERQAVQDARRSWMENCRKADEGIRDIANLTFGTTKKVWSAIANDAAFREIEDV